MCWCMSEYRNVTLTRAPGLVDEPVLNLDFANSVVQLCSTCWLKIQDIAVKNDRRCGLLCATDKWTHGLPVIQHLSVACLILAAAPVSPYMQLLCWRCAPPLVSTLYNTFCLTNVEDRPANSIQHAQATLKALPLVLLPFSTTSGQSCASPHTSPSLSIKV
jgi:hypothetical protein